MSNESVHSWIRREWPSISIGALGGSLMLAAKLLEAYLETKLPRYGEPLIYVIEHLGAVLVVAMLVRVVLEERYQDEFTTNLTSRVEKQVANSIDKVSNDALEPLARELTKAGQSVSNLDERLSSALGRLASALTYKLVQDIKPELRKVLEEGVLNSVFIRENYQLRVELHPYILPDQSVSKEFLEVVMKTTSTLKNQSGDTADYPCQFWLDDVIRPTGKRECHFTHFRYGRIDEKGLAHYVPPADLAALEAGDQVEGKISQRKGALTLSYDLSGIGAGERLSVVIDGKQLMRMQDVFIWSFATLTKRLILTIDLSGGLSLNELEIVTRPLHHSDAEARTLSDTTVELEVDQVFLPFQGVEIRWSPKAQMTT